MPHTNPYPSDLTDEEWTPARVSTRDLRETRPPTEVAHPARS